MRNDILIKRYSNVKNNFGQEYLILSRNYIIIERTLEGLEKIKGAITENNFDLEFYNKVMDILQNGDSEYVLIPAIFLDILVTRVHPDNIKNIVMFVINNKKVKEVLAPNTMFQCTMLMTNDKEYLKYLEVDIRKTLNNVYDIPMPIMEEV